MDKQVLDFKTEKRKRVDSRIKRIIRSSPTVTKWAKVIIHPAKLLKLKQKRVIKGLRNIIKVGGSTALYSCSIDIVGDGNEIVIGEACIFNNVAFCIRGSNNRVVIEDSVIFNCGGSLWVEDSGNEIHIGQGTTAENVHIAVTEPKSSVSRLLKNERRAI